MPVYNADRYLAEAIGSILDQTHRSFELIIIDDASSDKTREIIEGFAKHDKRIRYIRNDERTGIVPSLNQAISLSRGEYIARMDSDDVAIATRLEKQVEYLEHHKDIALVGSDLTVIDANGKEIGTRIYPKTSAEILSKILFYNPVAHPAVMLRKSVLSSVGGYDPAFTFAEDYELWLRIGKRYKFANLQEPLLKYRLHPAAIKSKSFRKAEINTIRAKMKAMRSYGYTLNLFAAAMLVLQIIALAIPMRIKLKLVGRLFYGV